MAGFSARFWRRESFSLALALFLIDTELRDERIVIMQAKTVIQRHAARRLGILALLGAFGPSLHAGQIFVTNQGSAGASGFGYSNTYDSTSGYISSGVGVTTTSGTAPGLFQIALTGSITDPNGNFGRLAFANSSASANLGTSEIKIFEATGPCYDTGIPTCDGGTNAAGRITENVVFHNATGLPETINFFWHTNVQVIGDATRSTVGGSTTFAAFDARLTYDYANCSASILNCSSLDNPRTNGWTSMSMSPDGNFGEDFVLSYLINPGDTPTPILENFNLVCSAGATCDGSHTAVLSLGLPTGVTFTSESGIFLAPAASSAPEPGTWAMLGSACLALGFWRWKAPRQRRATH